MSCPLTSDVKVPRWYFFFLLLLRQAARQPAHCCLSLALECYCTLLLKSIVKSSIENKIHQCAVHLLLMQRGAEQSLYWHWFKTQVKKVVKMWSLDYELFYTPSKRGGQFLLFPIVSHWPSWCLRIKKRSDASPQWPSRSLVIRTCSLLLFPWVALSPPLILFCIL